MHEVCGLELGDVELSVSEYLFLIDLLKDLSRFLEFSRVFLSLLEFSRALSSLAKCSR